MEGRVVLVSFKEGEYGLSSVLAPVIECKDHINGPAAALLYKWQKHRFEWCMGLSVPAGLMAVTCLRLTFHQAVSFYTSF